MTDTGTPIEIPTMTGWILMPETLTEIPTEGHMRTLTG